MRPRQPYLGYQLRTHGIQNDEKLRVQVERRNNTGASPRYQTAFRPSPRDRIEHTVQECPGKGAHRKKTSEKPKVIVSAYRIEALAIEQLEVRDSKRQDRNESQNQTAPKITKR
jgi:hypothetical protein